MMKKFATGTFVRTYSSTPYPLTKNKGGSMPTNDNPTRAQQQKAYRALENFVLSPKLESTLINAVKNKTTEKLKKDPHQYLVDKKVKIPPDIDINVSVSIKVICIWICRRYGRYVVLCVRRCFVIVPI